MPTRILAKRELIPGQTSELTLDAPQIAAKARPGHFVILRIDEKGERIPLTIADTDKTNGTIKIVYLVVGKSTALLEMLGEGDEILDVCGPLGTPTHIEKHAGPVICVGGGTGIAAMHHIAKGHKEAGNHVVARRGCAKRRTFAFLQRAGRLLPGNDGLHGQRQPGAQGICDRTGEKSVWKTTPP